MERPTDALHAARAHAYENARPDVQALVPVTARRVLDVGCSSGALGAALKARDGTFEVVGVERDPVYAARARERLDRVVEVDAAALPFDALGRNYDAVICADVLEHLADPWSVLEELTQRCLAPGGVAVVSLPNVRHWETFWQLGRHGTWPRRAEGLFDATHLRWFTLTDAHGLLSSAGLAVERVERVIRLRPRGAWDPAREAWLGRVPVLRAFVCFQHLLVGRRPR